MAGIYIHIPYCKKACNYCNFHFSTSLKTADRLVDAIIKEAGLRKGLIAPEVDTIYFGGGTPSLLDISLLKKILDAIHRNFQINPTAEITMEANPDDIKKNIADDWRKIGINRLSIGIQSFREEELKWMNRAHDATQARECIDLIQEAGFDNFSADLIYGSPLSNDNWLEENLNILLNSKVPHLSCYALTVEPRTLLKKMIDEKKIANTDDETQSRHFTYIMNRLEEAGYEHYEISNFAKPGLRSKHNSSYWKGIPYLGLGPSAHSFDGGNKRMANISNNELYIQLISSGESAFTEEMLSDKQQLNEMIMISLRMEEGLHLEEVTRKFGDRESERLLRASKKFLSHELLVFENNKLILSKKGKLMADGIAAELFTD